MKKVLIISTSLRNNSNSDILAKSFGDGATAAGNEVEYVTLRDKKMEFCRGCFACQRLGKCVIKDDSNAIVDKMAEADVIVWATPVYYYSMSGQMKTLIDRANSLYARDIKLQTVYLLATATENESYTPEGTVKGVQGWIDCFEGVTFGGVVFAGGVTDPGDIRDKEQLSVACKMGADIK